MTGNAGSWVAVLVGCLILYSCNHDRSEQSSAANENSALPGTPAYDETTEEDHQREDFDEDRARDAAEAEVSDESYTSIGAPYGCTGDCSGHEAGFRFRSENGYAGYNGDSPSFNEGGQAFDDAVDERVDEKRSEYDDGEEVDY